MSADQDITVRIYLHKVTIGRVKPQASANKKYRNKGIFIIKQKKCMLTL